MSNRQLFVTTDTALDTGDATETDPSLVSDGGFAVFDAENYAGGTLNLTTADGATAKMTLVRGGDVPQIEHIEKAKINSVQTQAYRAEQRQISAAGFSGSGSQTLTFTAGEDATVKLTRLEKGYEPFPRVSGSHTPKTGETPYVSAREIAEQIRQQKVDDIFGSDTRGFAKADVLVNEASSQLVDDATTPNNVTLQVTEGSRRVVATVGSGQSIANLSAGDMLRIGHATDLGYPVYVAESIDAASGTEQIITLDKPYVGDSDTGVAAGAVDQGAPAADDGVGLEITAEPSTDGDPAISFKTSLDGSIEDDPITSTQTPQTANGSTAQIKNLEEFSWGNRGYYYTNYFPQEPESHVADGTNYDLCTIIYENDNDDAVVRQNKYREIHIVYPEGNITLATLAAFFTG